jgi:arabinofuranan 3-O-arabinosyltransferase
VIDAPARRPGGPRPPPGRAGGRGRTGGGSRLAGSPRIGRRIRLLACCLLLELLPFVTAPGRVIADTKLDLTVDPVRFLARALTLWDPQQFGQLQDQAVGYLFPMGPFFVLGKLAVLPPWVIQRLWIGAVLIAAFLGTVRLAGLLGIGTPWTRTAAGLAYALSPAGLTLLGELSSEFLPAAMLPWILIPLVGAAKGGAAKGGAATGSAATGSAATGSAATAGAAEAGPGAGRPRRGRLARSAARSAAAVAFCGGINAAATIGVLVPAFIYILTLDRAARRWRILAWWGPMVVLATSWWSVPLLLLSKYGVSIVPYTESAAVTTSVTSLSAVLRGTEDWVGYLVANGQPWWQLGYRIATGALPTLLTGLTAGLGLAGLVRRELRARRFLLGVLLAGVVIISAGYVGSLGNPLAGTVDHLINGPASAFRNVRKFDPMIRLPVVLGLAHLLASLRRPRLRAAAAAAAALAVGGLALPGYIYGLAGSGSFRQIPSYWVSAANWLDAHAGHQAVLAVPGAPFGQYLWGSPVDDVLQPLTTVDWAERDLSTIGSPGNERLLDAIDQRLAAGDGSAGLTQVLARMGVKYVLVRNDLSRSVLNGAWPARVNQALATSPGLAKVAQFGPPVGNVVPDDAATNFDTPYPAVEIYQVSGAEAVATVQPAAGTLRVYGGPEALLTMADEGLLGSRPVLLNSDSPGLPTAASVVTDSLRRRVRNFGGLRTSYSPTLTATQPAQTFEATSDYTEPGWNRYLSVAQYHGIRNVTASSSASDIGALPAEWASGLLPYSAVDGNSRTMWESGSWTGPVGQWIQIDFDSPVNPGVIRAAFADRAALGPPVTRIVVRTAAGQVTDQLRVTGSPQPLRVPRGASSWLRITVTGLAAQPGPAVGAQVGISGISVPGVRASRTIVTPDVPVPDPSGSPAGAARDPAAVVLAKAQPQPSGCMLTSLRWVCSPALVTPTEEQYGFDQGFTEPAAGRAQLRGSAVLISPALVQKYAQPGRDQVQVAVSSTYTDDPQDQARSAFDGNPATTWIAAPGDTQPTLTIRWQQRRTLSRLTIQRPPGAAGLLQVLIAGSGNQVRGAMVSPKGTVTFAPIRTSELTIRFTPLQVPLEISGVTIPGVPQLSTPSPEFQLPCGRGPLIEVNGKVEPTRVSGTVADLLTEQPVPFTACSTVTLAIGANRVVEPSREAFDVQNVVLTSGALASPGGGAGTVAGGPALRLRRSYAPDRSQPPRPARVAGGSASAAPGAPAPAKVLVWTAQRRVLRVSASAWSYLVVNENFNAGWRASIGGRRLPTVRLDGWKQGWLLPAGTAGVVTLTYVPDRLYHDAVVDGLGAVGLILLFAVLPWALGALRRAVREARDGTAPEIPHKPRAGPDWARGHRPFVDAKWRRNSRSRPHSGQGPAMGREIRGTRSGSEAEDASRRGAGPVSASAGWRSRRLRLDLRYSSAATWAAVACGLPLTGFWLGGYLGAAILAAATGLFMTAASYRRSRWYWLELSRARLLTGLLVVAAACGATGEHLLLAGHSGLLVTALSDAIPQVICLVIVGRLMAALILPP